MVPDHAPGASHGVRQQLGQRAPRRHDDRTATRPTLQHGVHDQGVRTSSANAAGSVSSQPCRPGRPAPGAARRRLRGTGARADGRRPPDEQHGHPTAHQRPRLVRERGGQGEPGGQGQGDGRPEHVRHEGSQHRRRRPGDRPGRSSPAAPPPRTATPRGDRRRPGYQGQRADRVGPLGREQQRDAAAEQVPATNTGPSSPSTSSSRAIRWAVLGQYRPVQGRRVAAPRSPAGTAR